jgi:regulatory protein
MHSRKPPKERPPLDDAKLQEMALRYVGRFATTRAKLISYLTRKLRERGWAGTQPPDVEALADRFARQGYVDDAGFALSKARSLGARGYGKSRLVQSLRVAGVGEEDSAGAREHAEANALDAALRFARRRKLGPFGAGETDPRVRERALGAMVRAGHGFALSRAILALSPASELPLDELAALSSRGTD